jgi:hypothetical protein
MIADHVDGRTGHGSHPNGQGGHDVGEVFLNGRELVECCGFDRRIGYHLWKWKCPRCHRINGPTRISVIKMYPEAEGCQGCNIGENNVLFSGYNEISGDLVSHYRGGARDRALPFAITAKYMSELWEQQNHRCALTGWELHIDYQRRNRRRYTGTASLDRIDSSHGYVVGNNQWVHIDVQKSKFDFAQPRYLEICEAVTLH